MSSLSELDALVEFGAGFVTVFLAAPILASLALRRGWIDRREDAAARARKPRSVPVPLVGGAALLCALVLLALLGIGTDLPWAALLAAFALGTFDDRARHGFGVPAKLGGQVIVAALLSLTLGDSPLEVAGLAAWTLVALNAANTFDNADGALPGLSVLALSSSLGLCGAMLGFLPWNLPRGRGSEPSDERVPAAYLGDAGSHLIGVLWVATPAAWPALALPLFDLARLWRLRRRLGRTPWSGDRLHLAHRLEAAGASARVVVLVLIAVAAPATLLPALSSGTAGSGPWWQAVCIGWLATGALFLLVLRVTRGAHPV
jgi:UDP-N-acetylmuramyl pentapeptide phosphotransferase/UDP-N-acetylglucosamine-1-phosphate transferase